MNLLPYKSKIIFIGIFFLILNTLSGSSFDAVTKFLSSSSLIWYHYYAIGNSFALTLLLIFLFFTSGIKKNIILENKKSYFLPVIRGVIFIPIPIIVYYALNFIPLNIFTTILMTTPFFVYIFSSLLQKEKITLLFWLIIFVGFFGTTLVIKPNFSETSLVFIFVFIVAIHNALTNVIVSKYANKASVHSYIFYFILPLTFISILISIINPVSFDLIEVLLICLGGTFMFLSIIFMTAAFHLAGKYSSIISPFFFCQIIWASIFGIFFFGESLDYLSIIGIILIVISGTLTIINTPKQKIHENIESKKLL